MSQLASNVLGQASRHGRRTQPRMQDAAGVQPGVAGAADAGCAPGRPTRRLAATAGTAAAPAAPRAPPLLHPPCLLGKRGEGVGPYVLHPRQRVEQQVRRGGGGGGHRRRHAHVQLLRRSKAAGGGGGGRGKQGKGNQRQQVRQGGSGGGKDMGERGREVVGGCAGAGAAIEGLEAQDGMASNSCPISTSVFVTTLCLGSPCWPPP